jgi:hypothetical protein
MTNTLLKFWLVLALIFIVRPGSAQQENMKADRPAFKLIFPVDSDSFYESEISAGPYMVGPDVLQLYPNEKVFIEMETKKGKIMGMKVVRENKKPDRTVEVSFDQLTEGKQHQQMMLKIINPFDNHLQYRASIFVMKGNKWVPSHVLPVMPHLTSFETWPDVIVTIALDKWELTDGK